MYKAKFKKIRMDYYTNSCIAEIAVYNNESKYKYVLPIMLDARTVEITDSFVNKTENKYGLVYQLIDDILDKVNLVIKKIVIDRYDIDKGYICSLYLYMKDGEDSYKVEKMDINIMDAFLLSLKHDMPMYVEDEAVSEGKKAKKEYESQILDKSNDGCKNCGSCKCKEDTSNLVPPNVESFKKYLDDVNLLDNNPIFNINNKNDSKEELKRLTDIIDKVDFSNFNIEDLKGIDDINAEEDDDL